MSILHGPFRLSIERLAFLISKEDPEQSINALAQKFDTEPGRIIDAIDVIKIRHGEITTVPPVDWDAD